MKITCIEKEFVKTLKQKNLGEYHDLYFKSDTLLLVMFLKTLEKCV